jgi:methylated-DNA-[protein]-cysteine S-methyltransferase
VLIITGALQNSHPKNRASRQRAYVLAQEACHTILMLDWTEVSVVDDLKLRLVASNLGIRAVQFLPCAQVDGRHNSQNQFLGQLTRELEEYFASKLRIFRTPLDMQGTEFQLAVWRQLQEIPYGQTRSYAQIAEAIGRPQAIRAVGAANGSNPVAIVVPCHRVIGANGKLTGYGGGLPLKKRLLELEGAWTMDLAL